MPILYLFELRPQQFKITLFYFYNNNNIVIILVSPFYLWKGQFFKLMSHLSKCLTQMYTSPVVLTLSKYGTGYSLLDM